MWSTKRVGFGRHERKTDSKMDFGTLTEAIVFYLFAAISILAALGIVIARSPVRSALALALVFVSLAVMYVLLSAPFWPPPRS